MILSLNEIEATCHRAALGAKLPHGLAEDAAWIGGRLITSRTDGLLRMLDALRQAGDWNLSGPAFVAGIGGWRHVAGMPALAAAPAAADLRRLDPAARFVVEDPLTREIVDLCVLPEPPPPVMPISVDDEAWERLLDYAAQSYVPASETSRRRGAGAEDVD